MRFFRLLISINADLLSNCLTKLNEVFFRTWDKIRRKLYDFILPLLSSFSFDTLLSFRIVIFCANCCQFHYFSKQTNFWLPNKSKEFNKEYTRITTEFELGKRDFVHDVNYFERLWLRLWLKWSTMRIYRTFRLHKNAVISSCIAYNWIVATMLSSH